MAIDIRQDKLLKKVVKDNEFFKSIFNLIPPTFYFDSETKELLAEDFANEIAQHTTEKKGQKIITPKSAKKALYLDPTKMLTVTQMQSVLAQKEDVQEKNVRKDSHNNKLKSLEELQMRLQARLEELRGKRKAATASKDVSRNRFARKQSKIKQQLKKTTLKLQQAKTNVTSKNNGTQSNTKSSHIFNKEGKMVFSKFDFVDSEDREKTKSVSGKNYKKLLQSTEKEQRKLQVLEETNKDEANTAKEKAAWKKAVQKADGVKLKDNPELLKKALKRKEKRKNKSRKQWDERNKQVQLKMEKRQEKRQKNIGKKKQSRVDKKINKAKQKGRIVPGF